MATVDITGTIQTAAGVPVEGAVVRLQPAARTGGSPEAIGGVGLLTDPVEVLTDEDGAFTIPAVRGFQYRLVIPSIGLEEVFTAPAATTVRFDLLGLKPICQTAKDYEDANGVDHVLVQVYVPRIATVVERFDSLVVERATAILGPWVEVDTVDLVSDTDTYDVDDATPGTYYRAKFYKSVGGDTGEASDPVVGESFRESLVVSISEFKNVYLFGIDLDDGKGHPFPDTMYEWYIRAATESLEHTLGIKIPAHDIVDEKHDHYGSDYGQWGYLNTNEYPVIRIDEVAFQYPSMTDRAVISDEWVVLEDEGAKGVIQLVPGQGNIAQILMTPGALLPLWSGGGRVPGVWLISYRAGWEIADIPYDLKHVVGMMASLGIMNVAGDLVGGSGFQGWSTSLPGLSQNITTTNSSTNAGFGARLLMYYKEIKLLLPVLKAFYGKTTKMVVA